MFRLPVAASEDRTRPTNKVFLIILYYLKSVWYKTQNKTNNPVLLYRDERVYFRTTGRTPVSYPVLCRRRELFSPLSCPCFGTAHELDILTQRSAARTEAGRRFCKFETIVYNSFSSLHIYDTLSIRASISLVFIFTQSASSHQITGSGIPHLSNIKLSKHRSRLLQHHCTSGDINHIVGLGVERMDGYSVGLYFQNKQPKNRTLRQTKTTITLGMIFINPRSDSARAMLLSII